MKASIQQAFGQLGVVIRRADPLEESIPRNYNQSPFLPRLYGGYLDRLLYFKEHLEGIRDIPGDIVECGVSIGHGTLAFLLLNEYLGVERMYFGFDSFEGFPEAQVQDGKTPIDGPGYYSSPPEVVLKVLRDGKIPEEKISGLVHLKKGYFEETLPGYDGKIALLHLDCDLHDSYKASLEMLYDKVHSGGVILFDEYADERWPGATKAIDAFFSTRPEEVLRHGGRFPGYFVVKQ